MGRDRNLAGRLILSLAEVARACASTSSMIGAHYLATDSILIGDDDGLREHYLPDAAAGTKLGAFALTEPRAGSNPADMATRATPEGDGYRLRGVKHFISNADAADFIVVYAKTDPAAGTRASAPSCWPPTGWDRKAAASARQ